MQRNTQAATGHNQPCCCTCRLLQLGAQRSSLQRPSSCNAAGARNRKHACRARASVAKCSWQQLDCSDRPAAWPSHAALSPSPGAGGASTHSACQSAILSSASTPPPGRSAECSSASGSGRWAVYSSSSPAVEGREEQDASKRPLEAGSQEMLAWLYCCKPRPYTCIHPAKQSRPIYPPVMMKEL